jgi:SNF2 family DNA or RNA helicase
MIYLKPHQERALKFAIENRYSICSIDMGGGKTLVGLELSNHFKAETLVVCPSYLVNNWHSEILKWYGNTKSIFKIKTKKDIYFPFESDIAIISYELLKYSEVLFTWAKIVILDEGHYIANTESQRSDFCHRFIYENSIKIVLILTGTPIKNRVKEFYSLISLCEYDPQKKESDFLKKYPDAITFADHFSNRSEYSFGEYPRMRKVISWYGSKNESELKSYLKDKYFRVKSEEFLDVKEQDLIISMSMTAYIDLITEFEYDEINPNSVKGKAKRMSALSKIDDTIKYVRDLSENVNKIVIYTDYVESAEKIAVAFGIEAITGQMEMDKRKDIADKFWKDDKAIIVATIKSFSVGINLQCANDMVFNDICWSVGDLDQAKFRIKRIGQENLCRYHFISGSPQDEYIIQKVNAKRETIEKVT